MDVDSQEAPHTLFMPCQPLLGPLICTSLMEPLIAASCNTTKYSTAYLLVKLRHLELFAGHAW